MNVYIVVLAQMGDFYWYILDKENWDKLDERELCEQMDDVEKLATPADIQVMFDLLSENGWVVAEAAEGVLY